MRKSTKKLIKGLITMFLIYILIIVALIFHSLYSFQMPYIEEELCLEIRCYEVEDNLGGKSKEQIKKEIDKMFGNPLYKYCEVNKFDNFYQVGETSLFKITIKNGLTKTQYAYTLAHELTHLTRMTTSERFCEYNAFKVLWENNYKSSAIYCAMENAVKGETYCATHQINDYFKENVLGEKL